MNFVVLSSSRGTTFQAVIEAMQKGELQAHCLGLVTDRQDRGCIEKAQAAGIPVVIVEKQDNEDRESYDKRIHKAVMELTHQRILTADRSLLIASLGWMFIFTPWFIGKWKNRIINVHPALLPKFGGKGMYGMKVHEAVLAAGEKETGITIHLVDEGVDTGKILLQKTCPITSTDTPQSVRDHVQALEREWYPKLLQMIEKGEQAL